MKPYSKESLDYIKNNIYRDQFHEEDEADNGDVTVFSEGAGKVLEALQELDKNPILLDYVLACLVNIGITPNPHKFYYVIAHIETIMPYNEAIHKTFENYKKHCVDSDFGKKKYDHVVQKVFHSIADIEDFMLKYDGIQTISGNTKFENYSIKEFPVIRF